MTQTFLTQDGLRLAYADSSPRTEARSTAPSSAGSPRTDGRSGQAAPDADDTHIPVLCLSGLTRNMADFDPVVARFSGAARWIRMDYRGRGASDHAEDITTYSVSQEARDALALLDHLGVDRAAILGTSRGGLIAMELAVTAPKRLRGALLNDIGPEIDTTGLTAIMGYLGVAPTHASHADAAEAMASRLAPAFANVPAATWRAHAERLYAATTDGLALRYDARLRDAVLQGGASEPAPALWQRFEALAAIGPTALVRGANSDLLSAATAADMRARAPHLIFAEVPDRGHVPFLDEPEATAAIAAFLTELAD